MGRAVLRYDTALFDFDGTLADSLPWLLDVLPQVARRYGFEPPAPEEIEALRAGDPQAMLRALAVPRWKLPLIARHLRRRAIEAAPTIPAFPGVPAMLRALDEAGVTVAIVTSNSEPAVRCVLGEAAAHVHHLACGAPIFGKARLFRKLLARTATPPHRALAIGDELRDADAARAAGIPFAAVAWGYAAPSLLASRGPVHLFERVEDVAPALVASRARAAS